jgi:hypothetical protein
MKIIPVEVAYDFEVKKHKMRAVAVHTEKERDISYYFDDKLVSTRTIPSGEFVSDDDYIREILEAYCDSHSDVYADIFNNHVDMVLLLKKEVEVQIENYGVMIEARIEEEKDFYHVLLSTNKGENTISGKFRAASFSDVLEKLRIFINTLEGVSAELSQNIDEFSNDKVEERIKWK